MIDRYELENIIKGCFEEFTDILSKSDDEDGIDIYEIKMKKDVDGNLLGIFEAQAPNIRKYEMKIKCIE